MEVENLSKSKIVIYMLKIKRKDRKDPTVHTHAVRKQQQNHVLKQWSTSGTLPSTNLQGNLRFVVIEMECMGDFCAAAAMGSPEGNSREKLS